MQEAKRLKLLLKERFLNYKDPWPSQQDVLSRDYKSFYAKNGFPVTY